MKLHLPKALLTAVLAMCVAPAVIAADVITLNGHNNGVDLNLTDVWGTNGTFVRAAGGTAVTDTIGTLTAASGKSKFVIAGQWNDANSRFESLTIDKFVVGDGTGTVNLEVGTEQGTSASANTIVINEFIGKMSALTLVKGGSLTISKGNVQLSASSDRLLSAAGSKIIIGKDTTLELTRNDTVDYNADAMFITVDGGELKLGTTRQTLGKVTLTLNDGKVTSTAYGDGYGALDINDDKGSIVSTGMSSITGGVRLRATGKFNVIDGTLTVDSIFNGNGTGSGIIKEGLGTLKITSMASNTNNEAFYIGSTEMRGGAIEYALTSTGAYAGTISGRGDIINSGSGTVTLSKVSNLDGNITVSAGVLNITSLAANKTVGVDVAEGAALNIGSVSLNQVYGDLQLDAVSATYSDNSAGTSTTNGFRNGEVVLRLFDEYEWEGSIADYAVSVQDGDTLVTTNLNGSTYYVNEGTHKISDSSDYVKERAQGYSVAKDANLVIDGDSGSLTAAQLLTGTLGDGKITVSTDVTLTPGTSTQATGNLTVQNAKITLDTSGDHNQIKLQETSMSSFSSVTLDNATLEYVGATTSLNDVTVTSNGANLKFRDMAATDSEYQFKGTTTLNGDLTVGRMDGNAWKYTLNIEALTGAGDLSFTSAHETGKLNISSMQGYTGAITVTKGANGAATLNATTGGAVNLKGITLAGGATGTLAVSGAANLGAVNIGAGSLSISNTGTTTATTTLKTLKGSGSLSFTGNEEERTLVISSLQEYTGSLSLTKGTGATSLEATANGDNNGLVNLTGVTLSDGANGWIKVKNTDSSNTSSLGAVSLSGGSDLRIWNVSKTGITNISSLTVSGSATLGTYRDKSSFQGTVNITSLSSQGEGAELTLKNASQTDDVTVVNLNGGTFTGTINLESDSSKASNYDRWRKLQVNLANTDVAENAVINFQDSTTATATDKKSNYIFLGVGVEGAKVAGLTGTTTNAATIKSSKENTTRSLEIITADGADYSTNAMVESSVNLVKSGAGKQTISGEVSTTGSVKVNAGELALTGTSTLELNQLSLFDTTNATGGTLSVGSANGGTVSIVSALDKVGSVVVGKGSVLNGNLTLGDGTALTLNGYGDNAATINGNLTLGAELKLAGEEFLEALGNLESGEMLKILNVEGAFSGLEADLSIAADAIIEEQPLIVGYTTSNYYSSLNVSDYALIFQGTELFITNTAPIPEPTTATLSLLALTALAARRRRK